MANGGARTGSGRPPGAANRLSLKLQDMVAEKGVSPARVFLDEMLFHYGQAGEEMQKTGAARDLKKIAKHLADARNAAKELAPYVHSKLSSVLMMGEGDPDNLMDKVDKILITGGLPEDDPAKAP